MEFYERVSGARLHAAYVRPGGVALVRDLEILNLNVTFFWWGNGCYFICLYNSYMHVL